MNVMTENVKRKYPLINESIYAKVIGENVLEYVKGYDLHDLARQIDSEAIRILTEIQKILNDKCLDDTACYYLIDGIVDTFLRNGLSTTRHNEEPDG